METELKLKTLPNGIIVATSLKATIIDIIKAIGYMENELWFYIFKLENGTSQIGLKKIFTSTPICIIEREPLSEADILLIQNDSTEQEPFALDMQLEEAINNNSNEQAKIRQSFIENIFKSKAINNTLSGGGFIFYFNQGILIKYESNSEYNSNARNIFSIDILDRYYDGARKSYSSHEKIIQEVNQHADAIASLPNYLINNNTLNDFRYDNDTINYIAAALSFKCIRLSMKEFINSTHENYQILSIEKKDGIEVVKIKAYNKIFTFFNGYSHINDSISINYENKEDFDIDEGYVYVMINPSIDGLVKIGKTRKNPKERAKELSSATGVATPFIVAYYKKFRNCSYVESSIHKYLEENGVRYNSNREFFEIEIHDAVEIVSTFKE